MDNNIFKMKNEYWKGKEERAKIAVAHTEYMHRHYQNLIQTSAETSSIYYEYTTFPVISVGKVPNIIITPHTTVDALFSSYNSMNKTAVLNFSSFKNPGGRFLEGSAAQEESLCHHSYLFNVLNRFDKTFYQLNRNNVNKALYFNRAIYSPSILFMRHIEDTHKVFSDVITCAAPNKTGAVKYYNTPNDINYEALKSRCKFVLDIAEANSIDTLILGAYGCGVFGQDPVEVASIFRTLLESGLYNFDNVIFAIPNTGHSVNNHNAFKYVFGM